TPGEGVVEAGRAVLRAVCAAAPLRFPARGPRPGLRVRRHEVVGVALKALRLHAESVESEPTCGERPRDVSYLAGGLSPAHGADSDDRVRGEVDAGLFVQVDADEVVVEGPALQYR